MFPQNEKTLLARVSPRSFTGRTEISERLYLHAVSGAAPNVLRVGGRPLAGTSELLRQTFDRLFLGQRFVVPFYFSFRRSDDSARAAASRYLYEFLLQAVAFRRSDPDLLASSPDICELSKLALPPDVAWVEGLCEECETSGPLNDDRAFLRAALSAPLRAAAQGRLRVTLIIDDVHEIASLHDGRFLLDSVTQTVERFPGPAKVGGRRRFDLGVGFRSVAVEPLDHVDSARLAELLAEGVDLPLSPEARDLIAVQSEGIPEFIGSLITEASSQGIDLEGYRDVARIYASELLRGRVRRHFDDAFARAAGDLSKKQALMESVRRAAVRSLESFSESSLLGAIDLSSDAIDTLLTDEILVREGAMVRCDESELLLDFLQANLGERSDGLAEAAAIVSTLKRAPARMEQYYRAEASNRLDEVMRSFDFQIVPIGAIDHGTFAEQYRGLPDDEVRERMTAETDTLQLPQIVHAASLSQHLGGALADPDLNKVAVGVGFTDRAYRDADEIVWLAVEIDSKLEADPVLVNDWLSKLDEAAKECGFRRYRVWVVAPEGFSSGAMQLLADRAGLGSNRRQITLLKELLGRRAEQRGDAKEYEMVIPTGEETELVAAHALEDISRKHGFPVRAINQLKTALVEACINAAEHGLSPDAKIYQKFAVHPDRIVVTVSNRGLRLAERLPRNPSPDAAAGGRRGWGLELIRGLVDDLRIESVDDGTRVVMTKFLPR